MKPFIYKYKNLVNGVVSLNNDSSNLHEKEKYGLIFSGHKQICETIPVKISDTYNVGDEILESPITYKKVKAFVFYCVSGTEYAIGGDGSEQNPWASVNYALSQIGPIVSCVATNFCTEYVELICSGVCNYSVRPIEKNNDSYINTYISGQNRLIIKNLQISIEEKVTLDKNESIFLLTGISSSIILESDFYLKYNAAFYAGARLNVETISISRSSIFDSKITTIVNYEAASSNEGQGVCTVYSINTDSIFMNNCEIICAVNSEGQGIRVISTGIYGDSDEIPNSLFTNCSINNSVDLISITTDSGHSPIGNIECYGISRFSSGAVFFNCNSSSDCTYTNLAGFGRLYISIGGYTYCSRSHFIKCNAKFSVPDKTQLITLEGYEVHACGFHSNYLSNFYECTTQNGVFWNKNGEQDPGCDI